MTPLLGALAWSFLGAPESGFINQVWRQLGGAEALIDITSPMGIAWVMALFEGSVAYVMISAVMQSMDPALEEASQVDGRQPLAHDVARDAAAGGAGRAGRRDLRVRRDAGLVLGPRSCSARRRASTSSPPRSISSSRSIRRAFRLPRRWAYRCSPSCSLMLLALSVAHLAHELRDRQRQGVPPAGDGHGAGCAGCCSRVCRVLRRSCPRSCRSRRCCSSSLQKLRSPFRPPPISRSTISARRCRSTPCASAMWNSVILGVVTATIGVVHDRPAGLDHPAQPAARARRARISSSCSRRPCRGSCSPSA